jgi:hypothetical protein
MCSIASGKHNRDRLDACMYAATCETEAVAAEKSGALSCRTAASLVYSCCMKSQQNSLRSGVRGWCREFTVVRVFGIAGRCERWLGRWHRTVVRVARTLGVPCRGMYFVSLLIT